MQPSSEIPLSAKLEQDSAWLRLAGWSSFVNELPRRKQRSIELLTFFDYTNASRDGECTRDWIQLQTDEV